MLFSNIHPFIRWANHIHITDKRVIKHDIIAYDHRLIYVISGKGHTTIDGTVYPLEVGDLLIYKSGTIYNHVNETEVLELLCFNFDYTSDFISKTDFLPTTCRENFNKTLVLENATFKDTELFNKPFYCKKMHRHFNELERILNEIKVKRSFCQNQVSALFITFLNHLARNYEQSQSSIYSNKTTVIHKRILNYIVENFNKPLTYESLGKIFHYHPNYISKIVLKQTGLPLHQYLLKLRLEKAKEMLYLQDKSILEIALETGFENASYFSQFFKKQTGISPKTYKNLQ